MKDEQRRRVVAGLNGRTQFEAFEAAKSVSGGSDARLERDLIFTLKKGRQPFNRAAAAYVLQILRTERVIAALEQAVNNSSEHARVRGEAAEALAHNHRKRSHDILLKDLGDSSKDVRFWCAFALGEMAEKRAIPVLKLQTTRESSEAFILFRKKRLMHLRASRPGTKPIGEGMVALFVPGADLQFDGPETHFRLRLTPDGIQ